MKKDKVKKICLWWSAVFLAGILFFWWENSALVVSEYTFATEEIGEPLDGFRIIQISDLHNKRFGKNQKRLIERLKECDPDMIVITGDLVDSNHTDIDKAMEFVQGVVNLAPDQGFFPEYTAGLYEDGNTSMIVSRGLGNSIIPVRIFNRPEIVCVELDRS